MPARTPMAQLPAPELTVRYDGSAHTFVAGDDVVIGRDIHADVRIFSSDCTPARGSVKPSAVRLTTCSEIALLTTFGLTMMLLPSAPRSSIVPSNGCVLAPDTKLLNSGIASCTLRVMPLEGQVTAASSTPIVPFD
jgi:hypothetical protein